MLTNCDKFIMLSIIGERFRQFF